MQIRTFFYGQTDLRKKREGLPNCGGRRVANTNWLGGIRDAHYGCERFAGNPETGSRKHIRYGHGTSRNTRHSTIANFNREFDELDGDNNRVIPFSQYATHSKAEAKFIEESPYFGITIHNTVNDAKRVDMANVDKIESVIMNVNRMDKNSVLAYATSRGMNVREDEGTLRAKIIKMRVAEELERDVKLQNARMLNREIENEQFKNATD